MGKPSVPLSDALLTAKQARTLCRVSESRWSRYYRQHDLLLRGRRVVRAPGAIKGRTYWLRSYVVRHLHTELPTHVESA